MATDKDWKSKYKAIVEEFEGKETEWQKLEEILRKTIGRLSIAGRGIDANLDTQLKEIQTLSRKKQDHNLDAALETLAQIVTRLDDNPQTSFVPEPEKSPAKTDAREPAALLLDLLQAIEFKDNQREQLKQVCDDLLDTLDQAKNKTAVKPHIAQLSGLIKQNFSNDGVISANTPAPESLKQDVSINQVLTTLLERLAVIQGAGDSAQLLQTEVPDKIEDEAWPEILNQIVGSISDTLKKLNMEKYELEDFIIKVTQQLSKISEAMVADRKDHQSNSEDRQSLQLMMQNSMKTIEADFDNASEIGQLKNIMAKNLNQIQSGIEDFVSRANQRQESINQRNDHLVAQISEMDKKTRILKKKLDENHEKLMFDRLTGAGSRLSYDEHLEQGIARWQRYGTSFTYAILDIDHFKNINDTYGHSAGDKALQIVARVMMSKIRKSDSLFRIGGEEFVLLLPSTEVEKAAPLVDKIRETISNSSIHCNQQRVVLTLSAGLTEPLENDTIESLYERADTALYQAKNSGRNCQFIA